MRLLDRIADGIMLLLGLALIAMVGLSVYNVVARYVFSNALLWADEVTVFAMIALAFLGSVVAGWRNVEIRMDILANLFPDLFKRVLHIVQQAVIAVLCAWVAWQAIPYVRKAHAIGMRSDASGLPIWIIHAVIPISLTLIALIAALRCLRLVLGRGERFVPVPETGPETGIAE